MSLTPKNAIHEKQIKAGISGRKKGHKFEAILTDAINNLQDKVFYPTQNVDHIFHGNPATQLLQYISNNKKIRICDVHAWWLGGLATSGLGDALLDQKGNPISKCKSDVLIKVTTNSSVVTR